MEKKFEINLSFDKTSIVPVSKIAIEYIEDMVISRLLEPNKIVIKSKWSLLFGFYLCESDLGNGELFIKPIRNVSSENTKGGGGLCPITKLEMLGMPINLAFFNLLLESMKQFLVHNYAKITEKAFESFLKELDFNYLASIEYPAAEANQKYLLQLDFKNDRDVRKI